MQRLLALILLVFLSAPAQANGGIQLPEAPNISLFAMGLVGVWLGRRLSLRRDRDGEGD